MAFSIEEPSTPRRVAVRRELAVFLRTELDKVYVRKLETKAGTRTTVGTAHVYEDAEKALRTEPEHVVARNQAPEEPQGSPEGGGEEESEEG